MSCRLRHCKPAPPPNACWREDDSRQMFQYDAGTDGLLHRLRRYGWSTLRYLTQTEVHTYAFSVAANSILSLFPLIVLLLTVVRRVFHSQQMYNVVLQLLRDYLPSNQDFVIRNLQFLASVKGRGQVLSLVMLFITSTGIFLPLEVALNSIWGFTKNRSYLMNALVSVGLALACGSLALLSIFLTAQNLKILGLAIGDQNFVFRGLGFVVMKAFAIVTTIAIYFLIYWLLPHGKVPVRAVLPAAIINRPAVGRREVRLHPAASLAEFSGSLRAVLGVGHADLLVVLERNAPAGRRLSLSRATQRPHRGSKANKRRGQLIAR